MSNGFFVSHALWWSASYMKYTVISFFFPGFSQQSDLKRHLLYSRLVNVKDSLGIFSFTYFTGWHFSLTLYLMLAKLYLQKIHIHISWCIHAETESLPTVYQVWQWIHKGKNNKPAYMQHVSKYGIVWLHVSVCGVVACWLDDIDLVFPTSFDIMSSLLFVVKRAGYSPENQGTMTQHSTRY